MDCIIIGGGVIGLSVAWELSTRGLRCAVIDQGRIGRGCSWAGAGILPPARFDSALDPIDRLRGLSHQLYPEWSEKLLRRTGVDNGFRRCGGIYLASSIGEAAALFGQAAHWAEYGIESHQLAMADLLKREPALEAASNAIASAWWVPEECQVRPPHHLQALIQACRQNGCSLIEQAEVNEVSRRSSSVGKADDWCVRFGSQHHGGREMATRCVVFCCGAWASRIGTPRGNIGQVFPVRGQVVLYQAEPGLLKSVVNEGNRYLVPRDDGMIYVGSNEEEVGWEEGTSEQVIASLENWACGWVPRLKECPVVNRWSGLRPGSFDGFPFIGESPRDENLFFATGHYRSGLHLSAAAAVVLADIITGQSPQLDLNAFSVAR